MIAEHGHSILVRLQEKRSRSGELLLRFFKAEALRAQCIVAAMPIKRGCHYDAHALVQRSDGCRVCSSLNGCSSRTIWCKREVSRWV